MSAAAQGQMREAADVLHAQATDLFELAQKLKRLTKDNSRLVRGHEGYGGGEGSHQERKLSSILLD